MKTDVEIKPKSLFLLAFVVFIVWTVGCIILVWARTDMTWAEKGTIGDSFGMVNSLFAGLAFAGVLFTLYLQKRAIDIQNEQIKLQNDQIRNQQEQSDQAKIGAGKEEFARNFFQLMRIQSDILNGAVQYKVIGGASVVVQGRQRFRELYDSYVAEFLAVYNQNHLAAPQDMIERAWMKFFGAYQLDVAHYFRHLYNVVRFVAQAEVLDEHGKDSYIDQIRAQLSSHEMLLLFYNCLSSKGNLRFKPLVEKYSLLEHMPQNLLAPKVRGIQQDHMSLWNAHAFNKAAV